MAEGGAVDWAKVAGVVLGGIGTLLGLYNAWAQREERREKLVVSWLNCTVVETLFTTAEIDRINDEYERMRQHSEGLPKASADPWIGTLKERFIRADILLRNKGGKEVIVSEIQVDDWVFGERAQQPSLPGPMEGDFQAYDLDDETPVSLSKFFRIPPDSTVDRRLETYERSRHGPLLPGGSSAICPLGAGSKTEILLRVISDGQPGIILRRIPLAKGEDISGPPQWWERPQPWYQDEGR